MCGIVACISDESVTDVLVEGLRRLEYRGYDSAGIAVHDGLLLRGRKVVGRVADLDNSLNECVEPVVGQTGIAHTRWATHGEPTTENAHPHQYGSIVVVHNGIIDNYKELLPDGVKLHSETDTEVIAYLIDKAYKGDLAAAVKDVVEVLKGSFAIAVMHRAEPDHVVCARMSSPLVVGGSNESNTVMCASDVAPLIGNVDEIAILQDGDVADLRPGSIRIENIIFGVVTRPTQKIEESHVVADKGPYKFFMKKEIYDQSGALAAAIEGNMMKIWFELRIKNFINKIDQIRIVACGTSYHAAMLGRMWLEKYAGIPTQAELASEFRYSIPALSSRSLVIAISQSGETADTLAAVKYAKALGAATLAITNTPHSSLVRECDESLFTEAGPEVAVASTKCFTTQLVLLLMFSVFVAENRFQNTTDPALVEVIAAIKELPSIVDGMLSKFGDEILTMPPGIVPVARDINWQSSKNMLFLGRGPFYPIAMEGALKLKEISYIHAEAFAAGEMKHGPLALVDDCVPVLFIIAQGDHYERTLTAMNEVKARRGMIIAVTDKPTGIERDDLRIVVPKVHESIAPIVFTIPLQLLAYYVAMMRGHDVDRPKNLAKTVTVE